MYRALDFVFSQPLDVVWWRLLDSVGRELSLEEVREWIKGAGGLDTVELNPSELSGGGGRQIIRGHDIGTATEC